MPPEPTPRDADNDVSPDFAQRLADLAVLDVAEHPEHFTAIHDELAGRLDAARD